MRTKQEVAECIYKVLALTMHHPHADAFHSDCRLREDLALDSASILQLLVHLELDYGLSLPEEAVMSQDLDTVRNLTKLLFDAQPRGDSEKILDYDEDVKLHCFVSCLSEVLKRCHGIDQRPLYFGVWDSEIIMSDECVISYHSATISHQFFVDWYERLYGLRVHSWYRPELSKEENAEILANLVAKRTPEQHIIVMVDLFQLPERVNEFNKDPFPHYFMLGPTADPARWMIYDPDYRWEGVMKRDHILDAMRRPSVSGGYLFSQSGVRSPRHRDIRAYYETCFSLDHNPMTSTIRSVVLAHLQGTDRKGRPLALTQLKEAVEEVPVLSIRKYAYEHGLAYFFRELHLSEQEFDEWCEVIADLVKNYKLIHYHAVKLALSGERDVAHKILTLLDEQDRREFRIKGRLHEIYLQWLDQTMPSHHPSVATGAIS